VLALTVCLSAYSQDSQAVTYNAIATAYVTTTISQQVVFNSTMQQGGTFTMSVLAHNGGGRAGQSDTANVKIQFYTSTGALVTSVNSTNSGNLPNPNAVCGNPCIDTAVPWSTLTISSTLTAAQAATVAYATVSMYGVDGSFWAGDYGPWYRAPTFQLNGGGNLLYNPEFGPYNNITAQGWVSNPGFGACQGAWGGSNACIVNSDGVPGSSTVGLVANANGGGPSATGGTTSGQAGGYNNTMSVTNAGTGATAGTPPPAAPTVTGTSVSYVTSTSVNGDTTTTYLTPVTTTTYSDGTSTTSNGTAVVVQTVTQHNAPSNQIISSSSAGPTQPQTTSVNTWAGSTQSHNNVLYIEQTYGANNNVSITQSGVKNRIDFTLNGNGNLVNTTQTGSNYLKEEIPGWGNNVTISQSNTNLTNYAETKIQGNGNTVNHTQVGPGNHILFSNSSGDINTINSTQSGNAGHYLEVKMTGNWNSVTSSQTGNTTNKANIDLTNAGGAASVDLQQTGGKNFTIIQSCVNPAGCSTTVRQ
jgi:hypothetical protein